MKKFIITILLILVETSIADVETVEFYHRGHKIQVPLNRALHVVRKKGLELSVSHLAELLESAALSAAIEASSPSSLPDPPDYSTELGPTNSHHDALQQIASTEHPSSSVPEPNSSSQVDQEFGSNHEQQSQRLPDQSYTTLHPLDTEHRSLNFLDLIKHDPRLKNMKFDIEHPDKNVLVMRHHAQHNNNPDTITSAEHDTQPYSPNDKYLTRSPNDQRQQSIGNPEPQLRSSFLAEDPAQQSDLSHMSPSSRVAVEYTAGSLLSTESQILDVRSTSHSELQKTNNYTRFTEEHVTPPYVSPPTATTAVPDVTEDSFNSTASSSQFTTAEIVVTPESFAIKNVSSASSVAETSTDFILSTVTATTTSKAMTLSADSATATSVASSTDTPLGMLESSSNTDTAAKTLSALSFDISDIVNSEENSIRFIYTNQANTSYTIPKEIVSAEHHATSSEELMSTNEPNKTKTMPDETVIAEHHATSSEEFAPFIEPNKTKTMPAETVIAEQYAPSNEELMSNNEPNKTRTVSDTSVIAEQHAIVVPNDTISSLDHITPAEKNISNIESDNKTTLHDTITNNVKSNKTKTVHDITYIDTEYITSIEDFTSEEFITHTRANNTKVVHDKPVAAAKYVTTTEEFTSLNEPNTTTSVPDASVTVTKPVKSSDNFIANVEIDTTTAVPHVTSSSANNATTSKKDILTKEQVNTTTVPGEIISTADYVTSTEKLISITESDNAIAVHDTILNKIKSKKITSLHDTTYIDIEDITSTEDVTSTEEFITHTKGNNTRVVKHDLPTDKLTLTNEPNTTTVTPKSNTEHTVTAASSAVSSSTEHAISTENLVLTTEQVVTTEAPNKTVSTANHVTSAEKNTSSKKSEDRTAVHNTPSNKVKSNKTKTMRDITYIDTEYITSIEDFTSEEYITYIRKNNTKAVRDRPITAAKYGTSTEELTSTKEPNATTVTPTVIVTAADYATSNHSVTVATVSDAASSSSEHTISTENITLTTKQFATTAAPDLTVSTTNHVTSTEKVISKTKSENTTAVRDTAPNNVNLNKIKTTRDITYIDIEDITSIEDFTSEEYLTYKRKNNTKAVRDRPVATAKYVTSSEELTSTNEPNATTLTPTVIIVTAAEYAISNHSVAVATVSDVASSSTEHAISTENITLTTKQFVTTAAPDVTVSIANHVTSAEKVISNTKSENTTAVRDTALNNDNSNKIKILHDLTYIDTEYITSIEDITSEEFITRIRVNNTKGVRDRPVAAAKDDKSSEELTSTKDPNITVMPDVIVTTAKYVAITNEPNTTTVTPTGTAAENAPSKIEHAVAASSGAALSLAKDALSTENMVSATVAPDKISTASYVASAEKNISNTESENTAVARDTTSKNVKSNKTKTGRDVTYIDYEEITSIEDITSTEEFITNIRKHNTKAAHDGTLTDTEHITSTEKIITSNNIDTTKPVPELTRVVTEHIMSKTEPTTSSYVTSTEELISTAEIDTKYTVPNVTISIAKYATSTEDFISTTELDTTSTVPDVTITATANSSTAVPDENISTTEYTKSTEELTSTTEFVSPAVPAVTINEANDTTTTEELMSSIGSDTTTAVPDVSTSSVEQIIPTEIFLSSDEPELIVAERDLTIDETENVKIPTNSNLFTLEFTTDQTTISEQSAKRIEQATIVPHVQIITEEFSSNGNSSSVEAKQMTSPVEDSDYFPAEKNNSNLDATEHGTTSRIKSETTTPEVKMSPVQNKEMELLSNALIELLSPSSSINDTKPDLPASAPTNASRGSPLRRNETLPRRRVMRNKQGAGKTPVMPLNAIPCPPRRPRRRRARGKAGFPRRRTGQGVKPARAFSRNASATRPIRARRRGPTARRPLHARHAPTTPLPPRATTGN